MPCPMLQVKNVSKTFSKSRKEVLKVLDNVSLSVGKGEFVSLLGPSGCGKSTLLDMVAGLAIPDQGELLLDGKSLTGQKGHVSYMPQSDLLFPWRTVLDNVIVPLQLRGITREVARQQAQELLPVFGLAGFGSYYPHALSGGMKQRAAFLRTYLCKQDLMLLDEPFGRLDALTKIQMHQWLMEIWQRFQHSVLFVTHDIDEAILLSDRIYLLSPRPGRVLAEIQVDLPRPRSSRMSTERTFMEIKEQVYSLLEASVFNNEKES